MLIHLVWLQSESLALSFYPLQTDMYITLQSITNLGSRLCVSKAEPDKDAVDSMQSGDSVWID